jgi:hypothetical protein
MPEIITATQLRAVLGVSSGLFNDTYLEQIIETAENALSPFLVKNNAYEIAHELKSNVVTIYTQQDHKFYVGQTVIINDTHGHGWSGAKIITTIPDSKSFTFALVGANQDRHEHIPSAEIVAQGFGLDYYDDVPEVESAVYEIATDVFQSRTAPGGVPQAIDFTPGPYRMGKALYQRVAGILASHRDIESLIG